MPTRASVLVVLPEPAKESLDDSLLTGSRGGRRLADLDPAGATRDALLGGDLVAGGLGEQRPEWQHGFRHRAVTAGRPDVGECGAGHVAGAPDSADVAHRDVDHVVDHAR